MRVFVALSIAVHLGAVSLMSGDEVPRDDAAGLPGITARLVKGSAAEHPDSSNLEAGQSSARSQNERLVPAREPELASPARGHVPGSAPEAVTEPVLQADALGELAAAAVVRVPEPLVIPVQAEEPAVAEAAEASDSSPAPVSPDNSVAGVPEEPAPATTDSVRDRVARAVDVPGVRVSQKPQPASVKEPVVPVNVPPVLAARTHPRVNASLGKDSHLMAIPKAQTMVEAQPTRRSWPASAPPKPRSRPLRLNPPASAIHPASSQPLAASSVQPIEAPLSDMPLPAQNESVQNESRPFAVAGHPPKEGESEREGTRTRALSASVLDLLMPQIEYPRLARRRGWEGTVKVQVALGPAGIVGGPRVLESSGYPLLDRAALEGLRNLKSSGLVRHLGVGASTQVIVPVQYRLTSTR